MENTIKFINEQTNGFVPEVGIILGSGLGELADEYCDCAVPYAEIPNFIKSNVVGHKGRLVFAEIEGKKVVMMQGRNHFYEGHSMAEITYPVKVMKKLGVKVLILTNAAGAVNESFRPADLMIITDHINFMGTNPLIGQNDSSLGERFPDMSEVYKKDLVKLAEKCVNGFVSYPSSDNNRVLKTSIKTYSKKKVLTARSTLLPTGFPSNLIGITARGLIALLMSVEEDFNKITSLETFSPPPVEPPEAPTSVKNNNILRENAGH